MKKYILIANLVFIYNYCCAQTPASKLALEISSAKFKRDTINTANFILALHNNSKQTVFIPEAFLTVTPKNQQGNLVYEILYCDKDTIDLTSSFDEDINFSYSSLKSKIELLPSENHSYEIYLPNIYFNKKGQYKIRFTFRASVYNTDLDNVHSDWAYITIN